MVPRRERRRAPREEGGRWRRGGGGGGGGGYAWEGCGKKASTPFKSEVVNISVCHKSGRERVKKRNVARGRSHINQILQSPKPRNVKLNVPWLRGLKYLIDLTLSSGNFSFFSPFFSLVCGTHKNCGSRFSDLDSVKQRERSAQM